jgi:PAS domain S-box-containing protein
LIDKVNDMSINDEKKTSIANAQVTSGEHKKAQNGASANARLKELERSIWRLDMILEATQIGSWDWNIEFGSVGINDHWAAIIGYTREELEPVTIQTWAALCHPDDLDNSNAELKRHFRGETEYYEIEARMRHKNGHWVWVLDRGKVFERDDSGKALRMMGSHQDITARKNLEITQVYNNKFKLLITSLGYQFINIPLEKIDAAVNAALETIGAFVQADRSYIFQFYDNLRLMDNTHEWCAEGIEPQIDMLKKLPTEAFSWLTNKINNNEIIIIPEVSKLPDEAKAERDILLEQDIKSLILIPLAPSGTLPFGYIGFDAVKIERDWSKESAYILKLAGSIIANVLQRRHNEQLIQSELDLAIKLSESSSFDETLKLCLRSALDISGMDCGGIYLVNEADDNMTLAYHYGLPESFVCIATCYPSDSKQYGIVMKGNAVYSRFPDIAAADNSEDTLNEGLHAIAILPIACKGKIVACLNVASHCLEQVPESSRKALETVASHIGSAIIQSKHEEKVNIANKNLEALFNTIDDLLFIVDANGKILHTNKAAQKLLEYSAEELTRLHVLDVHPENQQQEAKANIEKMIAGTNNVCLVPLLTQTGRKIPVETVITHGEWDGKDVLFGISRDITERLRAQNALRESENRFRELTEMLPMPMLETDNNGRIIYCNRKCLEVFGYNEAEITSDISVLQLLIPEDASQWKTALKSMRNGSSNSKEYTCLRKNGQKFPGLLYSSPFIEQKSVSRIRSIFIDLTKLKNAEEALRESALQKEVSEKLKSIIDNIPGTVYRISRDNSINFLSHLGAAATGEHDKKIAEYLFTSMPVIHPEDRKMVSDSKRKLQNKKTSQVLQYRVVADDSSVRWTEDRRTSIFSSDGRYMGIDGIMLDITDRIDSEKEIEMLESGIRKKQRLEAIGTLAGGIAHDFNNILLPILGYAELGLATVPAEDPFKEYFDEIAKAAERAKNLVSQILTFGRPEEKNPQPISVTSLLKEALRLLRPSIPTTITIIQHVDNSCRNILADSSQIHQVIVNLCTNAFHAMESACGTLTIELRDIDNKNIPASCNPDAEYIMLRVIDTGTGMDKATLERLYEPFFTTKPINKGTGLGLAVVYGIVKSYKGEITVESVEGKGSTFSVFLPVINEKELENQKIPTIVKGKGRVLFVDDEPVTVKLIFVMLSRLGYIMETKTSPIEALDLFNRNPNFDLIITDLTMPGMTGIELAERINKKNPDIPIILMTGYGKNIDYTVPIGRYGIRQILKKPVNLNMLASTINEIINSQNEAVNENISH